MTSSSSINRVVAAFVLLATLPATAQLANAQAAAPAPAVDPAAAAPQPAEAAEFDRINAERDPLIDQFNEHYSAKKSAEALATREKIIPLERRTLELCEARFPGDKASRRAVAERLYDSLQYVAYEQSKLRKLAESEKHWADAEAVAAAEFGPDDWHVRECRSRKDSVKKIAGLSKELQDAYYAAQDAMVQTVTLLGQNKVDEASKAGEQAIELLKKSMGPEYFELGTCLSNLAMVRGRQQKPEEAAKLFLESEQLLRKTLGDHPSTARTLANYGSALYQTGDLKAAEPVIRSGYDMRLATVGRDNSSTADSAFGLGVVLFDLGQMREAMPYFSQNLDYIRSAGGENTPQAAATFQYLGRSLLQLGDVGEAVKCLEKAVELNRAGFGEEHAETLVSLVNLAEAYSQAGDNLKCSACLEQAAAIGRKILDPNHPFLARVLNDLGIAYLNMKSFSKALPNFEEALAIRKAKFGEENENVRVSLHNLGVANRDKGDFATAEPLLKQAQAVAEKLHGADSVAAGDAVFALAGLYGRQKKVDEAEKLYLDAIARTVKAASPVSTLGVRSELASLYEANGKFPEARDQLEAMHALALETLGPSAPVTTRIVQRLASVYEKTGDKAKLDKLVAAAEALTSEMTSSNNLKQLGLGIFNYHDVKGMVPAAGSTTVDGAPRLSWRVHLLPYLEQVELYKKFHLDEPWDSEHNRALIAEMPAVFQAPGAEAGPGKTVYLAVTGPKALFRDGAKGVAMSNVRDGLSNTIMLVEADPEAAVEWTRPADWQFDPAKPTTGVGKLRGGKFKTLFADGRVHTLPADIPAEKLNALVTPAGQEVVDIP